MDPAVIKSDREQRAELTRGERGKASAIVMLPELGVLDKKEKINITP